MKRSNPMRSILTLSAAALMMISPLASVQAGEAPKKTEQALKLDPATTGSVQAAQFCDPKSPSAGIVCKITNGDPNAKFPSAPITSFGF